MLVLTAGLHARDEAWAKPALGVSVGFAVVGLLALGEDGRFRERGALRWWFWALGNGWPDHQSPVWEQSDGQHRVQFSAPLSHLTGVSSPLSGQMMQTSMVFVKGCSL